LSKGAQLPKIKRPKAPKTRKPPKKSNGKKSTSSIEVKVSLPVTKVSVMSLLLAGLITLMGYAGYLGVSSIWKFTNPQVNVSLDSLKSLGYIARQVSIPAIPGPYVNNPSVRSDSVKASYLKAITEYEVEFRAKYPQSKLLNISDNELFNIGEAICTAKKDAIEKSGEFSRQEIINAFQAKYVLRYPRIEGLGIYMDAVGQRAFDHLCGGP
jgi:hypothetical protein